MADETPRKESQRDQYEAPDDGKSSNNTTAERRPSTVIRSSGRHIAIVVDDTLPYTFSKRTAVEGETASTEELIQGFLFEMACPRVRRVVYGVTFDV